jgi:prevent-host-death family protein
VKKVSAAEAKAKLSALVAEVAFGGQYVVIERRGKPLAALVNMSDVARLEQGRATSSQPRGTLALVGV